jgi:5'-deoxynucleotidase YfbR-like HD superfamily hydrolase
LIHDLAESVIGDIPTFAKVPKGATSYIGMA